MYVSSTTVRLHEPFLDPYIASKAAGDALAEVMGMEVRPSGIESLILVPGAFTSGTEHFAHALSPEYLAIGQQYGDLPGRISSLGDRLEVINAATGGALDVSAVGRTAVDVLALPRGQRPFRVVIEGQRKRRRGGRCAVPPETGHLLREMELEDLSLPAPPAAVV